MIGQTISHYKILDELGEGGMGVVYQAEDLVLKRKVALKFLSKDLTRNEESRKRFIQEARAASALDHTNICSIYEIDESPDGQMFISMAYYPGVTLRQIIENNQLRVEQGLEYAVQITQGIKRAHDSGIIHRDIKPENVIVTDQDEIKILDFGLAKLTGETGQFTKAGTTMGTLSYMSPEQITGEVIDHRSDIFSLGAMFYELFSGRHPFKGEYQLAIIYAITSVEPPPISGEKESFPEDLDYIIRKSIHKDPEERYQQTVDLLADLSAIHKNMDLQEASGASFLLPSRESSIIRPVEKEPDKQISIEFSLRKFKYAAAFFAIICMAILFLWLSKTDGNMSPEAIHANTIPAEKHLAILSFSNIGDDPDNQAFCDGLVETLTSNLSQLEKYQGTLWVVPASEIRKNKIASAKEALETFGINLAISGSVQRFSERVRLTLNLIDPEKQLALDSEVIDEKVENLSVLQDEAVIKVAKMLNLEIMPQAREALKTGGTIVPGAYEFYLQGRGYLQGYDKEENIDAAITLFKRALEADRNYALAYAGLGEAYLKKYGGSQEKQWIELALNNCSKAVELDDQLSEGHVTLGLIHLQKGDPQQSMEEFQRALELDPFNANAYRGLARSYLKRGELKDAEKTYQKAIEIKPNYWGGYYDLGIFYTRQGEYEDAARQFRHVIELAPLNAKGYRNLGSVYFYLDRRAEAILMFEKALEISPSYSVYSNLATLYFYQGDYKDAARMYEKALEINGKDYRVWGYLALANRWFPEKKEDAIDAYQHAIALIEEKLKINPNNPTILATLAGYYEGIGEDQKALSILQKVETMVVDDVKDQFLIGQNYELLGKREKALKWIENAFAQGYALKDMEHIPELDGLRADSRFQELIKNVENDK